MTYEYIIVGAGITGLTVANVLGQAGKKVLIIEERNHIGGNCYDEYDKYGVLIQKYGPHIFHTNSEKVFKYLQQFSGFHKFEHKVLGNIDGKLVPIPFNFESIDKLFEKRKADEIKELLLKFFPNEDRVSVFDLLNCCNSDIQNLGNFVYSNVFEKYTMKQWGIKGHEIDRSIINRVPVVLGYDDRYFSDLYQAMPDTSFHEIFNKMVKLDNIDLILNKNACSLLSIKENDVYFQNRKFDGTVIMTGQLDRFFNYKFGRLRYRSLNLVFEYFNTNSYQKSGVVNFNTSEEYTRITEFKKITGQIISGTTILKEFPKEYLHNNLDIPYYSYSQPEDIEIYKKYRSNCNRIDKFYCCGRLAEYCYLNMDKAIEKGLDLAYQLLENKTMK